MNQQLSEHQSNALKIDSDFFFQCNMRHVPDEERVTCQMSDHPIKKVLYVRGNVNPANTLLQHECVLCQQRLVYNSPLVFGFLEVGVGKKEKHLFQLAFGEEAGQVLHGVSAKARDIAVLSRFLDPQSFDPLKIKTYEKRTP